MDENKNQPHFKEIKLVMEDWKIEHEELIRMIDEVQLCYTPPEAEPDRDKAFEVFMEAWKPWIPPVRGWFG